MTKNNYILVYEGNDGKVNLMFRNREFLNTDANRGALSLIHENCRVIFEGFVQDFWVYHDKLSPLHGKPYSFVSGRLESIIREIKQEN